MGTLGTKTLLGSSKPQRYATIPRYMTRTLHYEKKGTGPTTILVPGMLGSVRYWDPAVEQLQMQGRSTIALDLLGFGNSPKPRDCLYSAHDHADAIVATLKTINLTQPITVVGQSLSTVILVDVLTQMSGIIDRAVFLSPMLFSADAEAKALIANTTDVPAMFRHGPLAWALCHSLCKISALAKPVYAATGSGSSLPKKVLHDGRLHSWRSYSRSLKNTLIHQDVKKSLAACHIPITLVRGIADSGLDQNFLEYVTTKNENISLQTLVNSGHHPLYESFEETMAYI